MTPPADRGADDDGWLTCWRELCRVVAAGGMVALTQRSDLWEPRSCGELVRRLADEGVWSPIWVSDPEPYLPGNDDFADQVGVRYVAARIV